MIRVTSVNAAKILGTSIVCVPSKTAFGKLIYFCHQALRKEGFLVRGALTRVLLDRWIPTEVQSTSIMTYKLAIPSQ